MFWILKIEQHNVEMQYLAHQSGEEDGFILAVGIRVKQCLWGEKYAVIPPNVVIVCLLESCLYPVEEFGDRLPWRETLYGFLCLRIEGTLGNRVKGGLDTYEPFATLVSEE